MRTEIRRIQQEAGITAVYVTHDQSEAMAISDKIIIMKKGLVDQIGDPHTVYNEPKDEFVADFIGESNFLRGTVTAKDGKSGILRVEGSDIEVADLRDIAMGDKATLVLRPESAHLADEGVIPGKVTLSRFMGAYQNYQIQCGDHLVKITEYNPKNKKIYEVGDDAYVTFTPQDVHALPAEE
jgi:iron(III) transport system ATP-binding protein